VDRVGARGGGITQISLHGYRRRLESQAPTLFELGGPSDYEHTIATTWELASFAPERVPRELFLSDTIADGLFTSDKGELALDSAIRRIRSFSLLTADETMLNMHRLVQHVIGDRLAGQQDKWLTIAERLLVERFPDDAEDPADWPRCERLLAHAIATCDHAADALPMDTAVLMGHVGRYLLARGEYRAATDALGRAAQLGQAVHGDEHPDTLRSANNLARAYHAGRADR
jgi:hypothetical protein